MIRVLFLCVLCASVVGCSGGGSGTAPAHGCRGPEPICVLDHDGISPSAFRGRGGSESLDAEETCPPA
jgi:hypothetical protein